MKLNKYILEKASKAGICGPGADAIAQAACVDDLLRMYVDGIDFCLSNNFPSNLDLVVLAPDKINEYGIYVDSVKRLVDRKFIVLLGTCDVEARYTGYSTGSLFVKHDSNAKVIVNDQSSVVIDCFDDSSVTVFADRNSKVMLNVYGRAKVTTDGTGQVKVVHKFKDTY